MVMRRNPQISRDGPVAVTRDTKAAGYGGCSMNEQMVQSHDDRLAQLPQAPAPPPRKRAWRFQFELLKQRICDCQWSFLTLSAWEKS